MTCDIRCKYISLASSNVSKCIQACREKFARGSKLRMNLRTSFVKISWIEDEIRKKRKCVNRRRYDTRLLAIQHFFTCGWETRTMEILFISRIINSCEKCSARITRGNESKIRYTRFSTCSLKFAYRLNNSWHGAMKTPSPLNDRYLVEIVRPWNIYTHRTRKRFKRNKYFHA